MEMLVQNIDSSKFGLKTVVFKTFTGSFFNAGFPRFFTSFKLKIFPKYEAPASVL